MLYRVAPRKQLSLARPVEAPADEVGPDDIDVLDELTKLAALCALGLLTQDEYEAQQAELRAWLLTT
jgi:hypothetical protein